MQEVEVSYVLGSTFTRSQGHHFFRHGWIAVCRLLLVKGGGDFVFVVHWCAGYICCIYMQVQFAVLYKLAGKVGENERCEKW